jgi:serine/threonine-protein kinase
MPLTPGASFGVYDIVARVGAGGMGEVWRARDPRLEREVALKVLPAATMADDTARARLLREARMASRLNHPNVCTIYEVGESENRAYIAMELVSGETLRERLSSSRMGVEEVVRLGRQMAEALAHAHDNGVVHRDFKSTNVIVTPQGRAKVLDFGLAKPLVETDPEGTTLSGTSLTAPGALVGTLAYMSPEQLRGRPADARSDVWALGVVLYEMAAGVRPFVGLTGYELSEAILSRSPRPLPAGVPPGLTAVIERCLAKEPGQRYQGAGEVGSALETRAGRRPALVSRRRWALLASLAAAVAIAAVLDVGGVRRLLSGGGGSQPPAIRMAVLPFANLTGDPEQEYLSDGLTQELIAQLGRLHPGGLSVIARSSVMRYKKGDTPVDQIGRELGVAYVLEGSARREANLVRITAELVHVGDQTQLWADTYEREISGLLALQSEVARRVAEALALKLLPAEQARLTSARTVDPEVYEAYLKGSYHWQKLTPQDLDAAQRYVDLALAKDPSYAPAYSGIAWVWAARQQRGIAPPHEAGPKAKAAALQAIALDDSSAGAHEALAMVRTWTDWDWAGAEAEWRRALELDPNTANSHAYFAHFLGTVGRIDEAIRHGEHALALDPFNALFHGLYAQVLCGARRYDDAMAAARNAMAIQSDLLAGTAAGALECALVSKGMRDEHMALQRERIARDPERLAAFERGLAEAGYEGAMRRVADVLAARHEKSGGGADRGVPMALSQPPYVIAVWYLWAGDYDRTIAWLERAFEVRDPNLPYVGLQPYFDPLRSDPRFQDLLRRLGLRRG